MSVATPDPKTRLRAVTVDFWNIQRLIDDSP
jgi:hypothetical protein